jgi:hypothetical protein
MMTVPDLSPHPLSHLFATISQSDKQILLNAVTLSRTRLYSPSQQLPILIRAMACERLDGVVKAIYGVVGEGALLDSVDILFGEGMGVSEGRGMNEEDETAELFMDYNLKARFFIRWRRELVSIVILLIAKGNVMLRRDVTDDVRHILHKSSLDSTCQIILKKRLKTYFLGWRQMTFENAKIRVFQSKMVFNVLQRAFKRRGLISAICYSRNSRSLTRIIRSWAILYVQLFIYNSTRKQASRKTKLDSISTSRDNFIQERYWLEWRRLLRKARIDSSRVQWMHRWRRRALLDTWKGYTRRQVLVREFKETMERRDRINIFLYWKKLARAVREVIKKRHRREIELVFGHWREFVIKKKVNEKY